MARSASSKHRFDDYRHRTRDRAVRAKTATGPAAGPADPSAPGGKRSRVRRVGPLVAAFWGLMTEHHGKMIAAMGALTVATLISLIPLYIPKLVVDTVLGDRPLPTVLAGVLPGPDHPRTLLLTLVCVVMVLVLVSVAVTLWARWHATRITKRLQSDVRRKAFEHASRLPLHRVFALKTGGIAGILRDDAGAVGNLVFGMLYNPWRAIIQFVGTLVVLTTIDWKLLLGGLAVLPVAWLTHRTWIAKIRPMFRDVRRTRQTVDAHSTEVFGGMRVVRAFGRQRAEAGGFVNNNHFMIRQELNTWWWMRGVDTAWAVIIPVASALLLLYGGIRILGDRELVSQGLMPVTDALTIGDLVIFLGYLAALLGPVATLAATAATLQNDLAALDRTLDLLEEPLEMASAPDAVRPVRAKVDGHVSFEDVSFTYPGADEPVLQDLSFEARPGQTVALVGASGAGKTTLCNLVARFYDPSAGRITLDGTDLCDIDVEMFRTLLGVVEQDVFLFDGTVADNIGYSRRDATRDQVVRAAELANAAEFIDGLEQGYETLIGERGVRLSGGQRQRLAIARAVLADPRLLILDEATSALDTHSERLIQASLEELMRGRTCFVIAHRLSTITSADLILVLSQGRVVERGTHDQLMDAGGRYRGMIEAQLTPTGPAADAGQPGPAPAAAGCPH